MGAGFAFAQPSLPSFITAAYIPSSMVFSGTTLTGWNDASGNGHHVTSVPSAPIKVTMGADYWLDFSGSKYCVLPNTLAVSTRNASVFVVWQSAGVSGSGNVVSMGDGLGGAGYGTVADATPSGLINRTPNSTSSSGNKMWAGFGWGFYGMVATSTARSVYLETETKDIAASSAGTNTGGVIGRWMGNNSNYGGGFVRAVFICDTAIDSTQLAELRAYCQYYYRVGGTSANAVCVIDGDSITAGGVGGASPWGIFMGDTASVGQSNIRPKFRNYATGGETTAQILAGVATPLQWLGDQTAFADKYYIVMAGTNSLQIASLASVEADTISIINAVHAAGYIAVITTVLPTDTVKPDRDTFNTWLVAGNSGADQVVDLRAVSGLTDASDTTYYSDGTHPTSAGSKIIGDTIYAQLFPPPASVQFASARRGLLTLQ